MHEDGFSWTFIVNGFWMIFHNFCKNRAFLQYLCMYSFMFFYCTLISEFWRTITARTLMVCFLPWTFMLWYKTWSRNISSLYVVYPVLVLELFMGEKSFKPKYHTKSAWKWSTFTLSVTNVNITYISSWKNFQVFSLYLIPNG